jgi:hypothetical protein
MTVMIGSRDKSGSIRGSYVAEGVSRRRRVIASSSWSTEMRILSGFKSEDWIVSYAVPYRGELENIPMCMRPHSR